MPAVKRIYNEDDQKLVVDNIKSMLATNGVKLKLTDVETLIHDAIMGEGDHTEAGRSLIEKYLRESDRVKMFLPPSDVVSIDEEGNPIDEPHAADSNESPTAEVALLVIDNPEATAKFEAAAAEPAGKPDQQKTEDPVSAPKKKRQASKKQTARTGARDRKKSKTTPSTNKPPKVTNFSQVKAGVCPYDKETLTLLKRTSGDGVVYGCTKGHQWYHNMVIKTCKCLNAGKDGVIILKEVKAAK